MIYGDSYDDDHCDVYGEGDENDEMMRRIVMTMMKNVRALMKMMTTMTVPETMFKMMMMAKMLLT